MASRTPARTVWSQRGTLEDYEGTLTEQLGALLRAFGLNTDIPVKTYYYKDDGTTVKYRVVIMLPDGLYLVQSSLLGKVEERLQLTMRQ
jgi:hypothetical protein